MIGTFAKLAGAALLAASFVSTAPASAQGWGAPHGYRPPPPPHAYMPPRHDYGYGAPRRHWKWRHHRAQGWHGPRPYGYGW